MKEDYLQLIWDRARLPMPKLKLTDGKQLIVKNTGDHNTQFSGPDFFNACVAFDDLDCILYDMDSNFIDSYTDTSSAVYILNTGYSFSTLKTKDVNLSIFLGPGIAMVNEVKYDRYRQTTLNENYYVTQKQLNTKFNINMGLMMTFKSSIGYILGLDSYNSSFFTGIHLYL